MDSPDYEDFVDYEDRERSDGPIDDPDAFCPMCGPPPCRHTEQNS
jgi:hypothetical protein